MRLSAQRPLAVLVAMAATGALLASGCGREHEDDLVNGKTLFVQKCASCHTLSRANASGVVGPNLDEAFQTALADGMTKDTVAGVVRRQIANVRRGSAMPAKLVKGNDARDVAAYIAAVAAEPGKDAGLLATAGAPKVSKKPVLAKNGQLKIDADPSGALSFNAVNAQAPAGQLTFDMDNEASIQHNIALQGGGVNKKGPIVGKGGVSKLSVTVKPGKYTFYCSVPGHADGGMKGTLTVK